MVIQNFSIESNIVVIQNFSIEPNIVVIQHFSIEPNIVVIQHFSTEPNIVVIQKLAYLLREKQILKIEACNYAFNYICIRFEWYNVFYSQIML